MSLRRGYSFTQTAPHDVFDLPMDKSIFSTMWLQNPKTMQLGDKKIRLVQEDSWRYISKTTTAKVNFSVLENKLLVEVSGSG